MSVQRSQGSGATSGPARSRSGGAWVAGAGRRFGRFRAFIFNMDGVVTDTARMHAAAWRTTFDRYLPRLSRRAGVAHVPFDPVEDYRTFMDGRLREQAAAVFLAARGITLPFGSATDAPGAATVCSLANDSHAEFAARLAAGGVDVYPQTMALIHSLRPWGVALALVSSSRNCEAVLAAAGLPDVFDVVVGGVQLEELGLPGKPDPAPFLEAARRLGVPPRSGVVVEDAVVGVEAARAGGFGLVVGLAHAGPGSHRDQLSEAADIVVGELDELEVSAEGVRSSGPGT